MPEKQITIKPAHEAERMAQPIIEQHHSHLVGARILFLLTTQERTRGLRTVLASAQKLPALQKYLSSGGEHAVEEWHDFLILISETEWNALTREQRIALVDHELCHCWADPETGAWQLRGHDVEEFADVIARHGLWKQDVRTFGEVIRQLRLTELVGAR